jgi:hypothetical protein
MKCEQWHRQILFLESLEALPPEIQVHVADCPACRSCLEHLMQIENTVPEIPVPSSQTKEAFVRDFLEQGIQVPCPQVESIHIPRPYWKAVGFVGAAAAVLIACGIYLGHLLSRTVLKDREIARDLPAKNQRPPSLATILVQGDMRLAQAKSPRQRVEVLAELARAMHGEGRALAQVAGPKEMQSLARLFDELVKNGLVPRARDLPVAERKATLRPIANHLEKASQEAEELAARAAPETAGQLRHMAAAARDGDRALRALLAEEATQ